MAPNMRCLVRLFLVAWIVARVSCEAPSLVHVVVAASKAHYPGLLNVVGSATNSSAAPGRLRFLLLVSPGEASGPLRRAAVCAGQRQGLNASQVDVRPFRLEDHAWPSASLSAKARLAEPLNFARFFVHQLLPDAKRAVYLDSDVVVRRDLGLLDAEAAAALAELTTTRAVARPPGRPPVIAVVPRDFKKVCGHLVDCTAAEVARRGITEPDDELHAFNAGVVVMDLERWRSEGILDSVGRWISANGKLRDDNKFYRLGSNPPLVLAVRDQFARLDVRWNCLRGLHRQHAHNTRCWEDAGIRHYPGDSKPWKMDRKMQAALGYDGIDAATEACLRILGEDDQVRPERRRLR